MWEECISLKTMYDFNYALKRLSMDPLISLNLKDRWIDIPVEIASGEKHTVRVQAEGSTSVPEFRLISNSMEHKDLLIKAVFHVFQWDVDLTKINEHFIGTNLEQLFYAHPGTPVVKDFDIYYSLMKAIIHQQLNMKFAYTLSTRFVEQYGDNFNGVWFFPKPEKIAEISYQELREMQFSQRKAEYVIDTSRQIANRELDLKQLAKKSDKEVIETLTKIRGIGPWTAQSWLLFALGRGDQLPKADIGIQNALKFYFGLERKPTIPEITEMSKQWAPLRSYASLTLWRSIE